jgi:hypothetical protein
MANRGRAPAKWLRLFIYMGRGRTTLGLKHVQRGRVVTQRRRNRIFRSGTLSSVSGARSRLSARSCFRSATSFSADAISGTPYASTYVATGTRRMRDGPLVHRQHHQCRRDRPRTSANRRESYERRVTQENRDGAAGAGVLRGAEVRRNVAPKGRTDKLRRISLNPSILCRV